MTHTEVKPHKCNQYDKSFSHTATLKSHLRIHTGEKPYQCSECTKTFSQYCDLKIHLRTHTGEKPYQCKHCDKYFSQRGNLQSIIVTISINTHNEINFSIIKETFD